MSNSEPVIEASGLTKSFKNGSIVALENASFTVERGQVVGLLGENGAGKTTLIDIILGLTRPTSGTLQVFGTQPRKAIANAQVAAVLQTGGLLGDITVSDTLRIIASTFPEHRPIEDVVKQARLEKLLNRRVSKCSGGEQQRLKFALALLGEPELLILDEPTAGMDAGARHDFWQDIYARAEAGVTIVFSTHYLEEAESFAERIVMLNRGHIVADDTTANVIASTTGALIEADVTLTEDPGAWPGVVGVDTHGRTLRLRTTASDELARYLLTSTDAENLRITPASLEDAFISINTQQFQENAS